MTFLIHTEAEKEMFENMNQSKKILAALVAIPASVVVAGEVQAAETTELVTFELKNSFVNEVTTTSVASEKTIDASSKSDLNIKVIEEMNKFTKGFTVNYTNTDLSSYKEDVKTIFTGLKDKLNTNLTDISSIDTTILYGMFNNVKVEAKEIYIDDTLSKVELKFSFNYFVDQTSVTALNAVAAELTTNTKAIINSGMNDIQKIKAIHDYLIKNAHISPENHSVANLVLNKVGSSHAYALWTYKLLKAAGINVRYVTGINEGELYAWNLVELADADGWYHLDVAGNDSVIPNSTDIKYKYFLANNTNIAGRQIYFGNESITNWGSNYRDFKDIVNPAQSDEALYFADAENNGKIYKLNLTEPFTKQQIISEATSGFGKILYNTRTSADNTEIETLFFINDSAGKFLYKYDLNSAAVEPLKLLVNEAVRSITINGSNLTYTLINGGSKTIRLNQLDSYDTQQAQIVIDAIAALGTVQDQTTTSFKNEVTRVRNLYLALTPDQQIKVSNITNLETIEKTLAGSDPDLLNVIQKINTLNILNLTYIDEVTEAKRLYDDLEPSQIANVYNKTILETALKKVAAAKILNTKISSLIIDEQDPFKTRETFIQDVIEQITEYDDLLPSLKEAIETAQEIFLTKYRDEAIKLRNELQSFVNTVNILNENSLDYLTLMVSVKKAYEEDLLISQLYLLTNAQKSKIEQNISKAAIKNQEIATFNTYMDTVSSEDAATIQLTQRLITDMKAADALYKSMIPAQKAVVDKRKLEILINRITALETGSSIKVEEVKNLVANLDYTALTIDELVAAFTSADTAMLGLNLEEKALLPEAIVEKFDEYDLAVDNIKSIVSDMQSKINNLTEANDKIEVEAVRTAYTDLTTIQKHYVSTTNLDAQEARIQLAEETELAQPIIVKIEELLETATFEEVKVVYDEFDGLSDGVKAQVTNKNKLLDLWSKVYQSKEAINRVIAMIELLNINSSNTEIMSAKTAFEALPEESRNAVINYSKLEGLVATMEASVIIGELVQKIKELSDETTALEIKALRDEYEALADQFKILVPANVLELLEFFEKQLEGQVEKAKAEAQLVIDRINRIDLNTYTETQIKSIRIAYMALSALAKTYVTEELLQKLVNAEAQIIYQNTVVKQAKLEAAAFDEYMEKVDRNSTTQEIAAARALYNRLSAEARKHVVTYDKLVRLETMWKDPEYLELVYTYYPEYIHAIKPGGIEVPKQNYDPLYIPDDSERKDVANFIPTEATWSSYEEMTYQNGRYVTKLTSSQVSNVTDRTMTLKADDIEIVLPVVDLKGTSGTVGVSVGVTNDRLNIQFTEGNNPKYFSEYVEIRVPMSALKGNASQMIERVESNNGSAAVFKVEGSDFIIRTKSSGIFRATTSRTSYSDLGQSSEGMAIRELAKRGVTYNTTGRFVQIGKHVTRADAATLIAKALDLSSPSKTKYQDLGSLISASRAQGLLEAGIMSGITANRFGTNSNLTKQEAAIIIANIYRYLNQDLSLAYNPLNSNYTDVSNLTFEARQSIAILELFGVVDGKGAFNPNQQLTRGQFAELFYKSLRAIDFL